MATDSAQRQKIRQRAKYWLTKISFKSISGMDNNLSGLGYIALGMLEEARAEFLKVPPDDPAYATACAELLSFIDHQDAAAQSRGADEGLALIRSRPEIANAALVQSIAQCLHFAGRSKEAYELWRDYTKASEWNSDDSYLLASFASENRSFVEAAQNLVRGIPRELTLDYSHLLVDADFEPLFRHAAEENMNMQTALSLANPKFKNFVESLLHLTPPIDGVLFRGMPVRFRSQIRQNLATGFYEMPPSAPEVIRREYLQWLKGIVDRNAAMVLLGIDRACNMVLDAQFDFAVAAVKRGDFLAARHHASRSVAARPDSFDRFDAALSPLGLDWFFDDIREAWEEDPSFRELLRSTTPRETIPPQSAMENLDDCGSLAKRTTFWILTRSTLARYFDEKSDVRAWHVEVIRRWPKDPAAYHNLLLLLEDEQAWEAASAVLEKVPKSFLCLRAAESHRLAISERRMVSFPKYTAFYGQPDLGGVVLVEDR